MNSFDEELEQALKKRQQQGLYRQRLVTQSAQGVHTSIDGRSLLSFCSNDYLGLANHSEIKKVFTQAVERYGVGSGSAHLVNGHSQLHHECEHKLAEFSGRDRALLFSTGYMANLAISSALLGRKDIIYQDKLNHASIIDAAKLVGSKLRRYRHGDLEQLSNQLTADDNKSLRRLVMTDGVFSMDGDKADVAGLARLCQQHSTGLMVDDAHGFGVLGQSGAGLCEEQGMNQQRVPILMATLGKAIGVSGAFVAGSDVLVETLIQQARPYIYTTAAPPACAAAVMKSLDIIRTESWRREKLMELIQYFRQKMQTQGIDLMASDSAIQPVLMGDNQRALNISQQLFEEGIHVTAIRPPTVPEGTARLRITLSAEHDFTDIDTLVKTLSKIMQNS